MKRTLARVLVGGCLCLAIPAYGQLPGTGLLDRGQAARFLTQTTFGPTLAEINSVSLIGRDLWLARQLTASPSSHLERYEALLPQFGNPADARLAAWWEIALTGDDQLRQRVAFALSEIFVVSDQDSQLGGRQAQLAAYYDLLVEHAFGNYRELLEAVTLSPAMGLYLSHLGNDKPNPETGRRPDENYARESMQLFSIGLWQLNPDGSPVLDGAGERVPTYDQALIESYARVYTGWTWAHRETFGRGSSAEDETYEPMKAFADHHDMGEKRLLKDVVLPAGQTPEQDLEAALDSLTEHPNTAPFIARQLIIKLITSNPSPEFIARIAGVFENNGFGVRGDLGAVVRSIFLDPEARQRELSDIETYGKLKEPILRLSQLLRAFDASSPSGVYAIGNTQSAYAQAPLRSPSVFNFFSPNYALPGAIEVQGLLSPEFQLQTETQGMQIVDDLARRVENGLADDAALALDLSQAENQADDAESLADYLEILLLGGEMSDALRQALSEVIAGVPEAEDGHHLLLRAKLAAMLVVVSPEFAVQR